MIPEALLALQELVLAFDRHAVPYVVGGSMASGAWGEPRTTHDVDVLAGLRGEHIDDLIRDLSRTFYADAGAAHEAVSACRSFNVIHLKFHLKIDVFVAGDRVLDREQLERRVSRVLHPELEPLYVTSPEVIVLRKLDWYRKGDEVSERQLRDVVAVIKVQGNGLDLDYVRRMAGLLDLTSLLDRALTAAR